MGNKACEKFKTAHGTWRWNLRNKRDTPLGSWIRSGDERSGWVDGIYSLTDLSRTRFGSHVALTVRVEAQNVDEGEDEEEIGEEEESGDEEEISNEEEEIEGDQMDEEDEDVDETDVSEELAGFAAPAA